MDYSIEDLHRPRGATRIAAMASLNSLPALFLGFMEVAAAEWLLCSNPTKVYFFMSSERADSCTL